MPDARSQDGRETGPLISRPPVVLMYHGFAPSRRDDDPENLFVEASRFEAQLAWLLRSGWKPLDLTAYLHARRTGINPAARSFLVTIDDGLESVATLAEPVLARLGVPAVIYVPAALVGATARWLHCPADEPILDAEGLRALADKPLIEIGLHGADHTDMSRRSVAELEQQVLVAHDELAEVLGTQVRSFAYPFGGHDARARMMVQRSGLEVGFSVFDDAGQFAISRVDVNATDTLTSFRIKMQLPGYRNVWRALDRAPAVRRGVRAITTFPSRRRR